ncbi:MAG: c-type cytochrome [Flammeovirgaceae bacterium]
MKRKIITLSLLMTFCMFVSAFVWYGQRHKLNDDHSVYQLLLALGETKVKHDRGIPDSQLIQQGEDIVLKGRTQLEGKGYSNYVSKFYVCTNCHNVAREDPDLQVMDPDKRLEYTQGKQLPFLQGSTFYGIVNRASWYNDDYIKKYGDLVKPARNDLSEAVQLCAKVCSQGRYLKDWELEAVMAYLWSLELKLEDLALPDALLKELENAQASGQKNPALAKQLKRYYATKSPATFSAPPADKAKGYEGIIGNAENGAKIYASGCQHCHKPNGASRLVLDDSKFTFRKLKRNLNKSNNFSIYEIVRHGTHALEGHKAYMPHYTLERMSHQQVEDLKAFILEKAK